jgi:hypothetical protein
MVIIWGMKKEFLHIIDTLGFKKYVKGTIDKDRNENEYKR